MPVSEALAALLPPRMDEPTLAWFRAALASTSDLRSFRAEWSRVGRRAGSVPVTPTPEEADLLRAAGPWPFVGWGMDECVRAVLLLRALAAADPETHVPLVRSLYLRGTIRERQALLRVLAWLPEPGRFADLAAEATRTHVVSVFEAIAVGNPYPARWLVRPIFDQMVQKALAFRMPPERVLGLADRVTPAPARVQMRAAAHPGLPALLAP